MSAKKYLDYTVLQYYHSKLTEYISTNYLPKIGYEWNKSISFGNTGYLKIGSFAMYDSNVTIDITSTTSVTYSATIVIATQNTSESSIGSAHVVSVYGDADNRITSKIKVVWTSGSRNYNVYFVPEAWSKNIIHIRAVGIYSASDICISQTGTAPSSTSGLVPVNVLKTNYLPLSGNSTLTGTIYTQSIIPSANNTYGLGVSNQKFKYLYVDEVNTREVKSNNILSGHFYSNQFNTRIEYDTQNKSVFHFYYDASGLNVNYYFKLFDEIYDDTQYGDDTEYNLILPKPKGANNTDTVALLSDIPYVPTYTEILDNLEKFKHFYSTGDLFTGATKIYSSQYKTTTISNLSQTAVEFFDSVAEFLFSCSGNLIFNSFCTLFIDDLDEGIEYDIKCSNVKTSQDICGEMDSFIYFTFIFFTEEMKFYYNYDTNQIKIVGDDFTGNNIYSLYDIEFNIKYLEASSDITVYDLSSSQIIEVENLQGETVYINAMLIHRNNINNNICNNLNSSNYAIANYFDGSVQTWITDIMVNDQFLPSVDDPYLITMGAYFQHGNSYIAYNSIYCLADLQFLDDSTANSTDFLYGGVTEDLTCMQSLLFFDETLDTEIEINNQIRSGQFGVVVFFGADEQDVYDFNSNQIYNIIQSSYGNNYTIGTLFNTCTNNGITAYLLTYDNSAKRWSAVKLNNYWS